MILDASATTSAPGSSGRRTPPTTFSRADPAASLDELIPCWCYSFSTAIPGRFTSILPRSMPSFELPTLAARPWNYARADILMQLLGTKPGVVGLTEVRRLSRHSFGRPSDRCLDRHEVADVAKCGISKAEARLDDWPISDRDQSEANPWAVPRTPRSEFEVV
jgi:hypothetical protein